MKNDPEHDRLLDDVLEELAPPDFRAQLLDCTLAQVRRKKQVRRRNRGLLAAACVACTSIFLFQGRAPVVTKHEPSSGTLVMISTRPFNASMIVESTSGSVAMITSAASRISMIETDPARREFRVLTDDELLALVPGRSAMLVRQGPHEAELLIVDSGAGIIFPGDGADQ
jgi:hypothetical protein